MFKFLQFPTRHMMQQYFRRKRKLGKVEVNCYIIFLVTCKQSKVSTIFHHYVFSYALHCRYITLYSLSLWLH